ncbi:MAG: S8 family serine peptidase [Cyanobacteria bacterium P01_H01_bin.121]
MPESSPQPDLSPGLILQRGGEELRLSKVDDRFVVALEASVEAAWLQQAQFPLQNIEPITGTQLIQVVVAATQLELVMSQLRGLPQVRFASHVYRLEASPNTVVYFRDTLTLQFTSDTPAGQIAAIATRFQIQQQQPVLGLANTFVFQLTQATPENPIKLANRLIQLLEVVLAEPNAVVRQQAFYRPRDPLYRQQWYLHNTGGTDISPQAQINAEAAWDITRGDRSIVIAIADDAIDLNHPDLQGMGKIVAPRDLRDQDASPLPSLETDNHGTAVAGLAIGEENGTGIVGVAPGCALMPIRTSGFVDDESVEEIFQWAVTNGADVISCSWGPGSIYYPLSTRQRAALSYAANQGRNGKGCIILFAAGNINRPLDGSIDERGWPPGTLSGSTRWLNGFTVHPDVITVSACTSLATKAAYSNWGAEVFVCAPSNNGPPVVWLEQTGFIEAPPTIRSPLPGKGVLTADRIGPDGYSTDSFTGSFGGTSSSTPIVAGVVGLILSANPYLTVDQVKTLLRETTDRIVDASPDPQLGLELGIYANQGHSPWFGYGKVNAGRAVQAARTSLPTISTSLRAFTIGSSQRQPLRARQRLQIPLRITETGLLQDVQISVQLTHGFIGNLSLTLISPQQTTALLQSRTGVVRVKQFLSKPQLFEQTYTTNEAPALTQFFNEPVNGLWQLQISDPVGEQSGEFLSCSLSLKLATLSVAKMRGRWP